MGTTPPGGAAEERGAVHTLWSEVGSIQFAVTVLVLIALASVLGTIIPQMPTPRGEVPDLLAALERDWGTAKARLYIYTHAYDIWHAWWYQLLLVLLLASACVCTVDRLRPTLRRLRAPRVAVEPRVFATLRAHRRFTSEGSVTAAAETLRRHFRSHGYRVLEDDAPAARSLLARKGALSILGPLTVHMSLVVILVAAVWCTSPRFGNARGSVSIIEGGLERDPISGLYVECRDFEVEYSPQRRGEGSAGPVDYQASAYISRVALYAETDGPGDREVRVVTQRAADGAEQPPLYIPAEDPMLEGLPASGEVAGGMTIRTVHLERVDSAVVKVNHPAHVRGIDLFQQSYGLVSARVTARNEAGREIARALPLDPSRDARGMPYYVPRSVRLPVSEPTTAAADGESAPRVSLAVTEFAQRYEDGDAIPEPPGSAPKPAVRLSRVTEEDGTVTAVEPIGWVEHGGSLTESGWTVTFDGPVYSTTLEVRRFPGLWLLLTGFAISCVGMVLCFWIPLREVRARLEADGDRCAVSLGMPRSYRFDDAGAIVTAAARAAGWSPKASDGERRSGKDKKRHDG